MDYGSLHHQPHIVISSDNNNNNNNKRQKLTVFDVDFVPADTNNVNHLITDFSNRIVNEPEDQWARFLNQLNNPIPTSNPNSYPTNRLPTLFEFPAESSNQNVSRPHNLNQQQQMWYSKHNPISLTSDNSNSFVNMGYPGHSYEIVNVSNSRYFGRPLIKNAAGTNFGRKIVQPFSNFVSNLSGENLFQQQQFHQGQYCSPIGENVICYNIGFPTPVNNLQSTYGSQSSLYSTDATYNPQISNCETFAQQWAQMPALSEPNQRVDQFLAKSYNEWNEKSNANKTHRLNSWEQVQGQLPVFEESLSHNCWGLFCNICNSTNLSMGSRKRKNSLMDGTLMDVLTSFLEARRSQKIAESLSYQHLVDPPPLEKWSNNGVESEDVSAVKSKPLTMASVPEFTRDYEMLKGSEGNSGITNDECIEQSECDIEEKKSLGKEESEVNLEMNTTSDGFEMVLELEKLETQTQATSGDDKGSGLGSGSVNIRNLSASLADSFTASHIKEHLSSFVQHNKESLRNIVPTVNHDTCHLCSKNKLLLAPIPIYCSCCESRIKQNATYFRSSAEENTNTQHSVCVDCFKRSRGDTLLIRKVSVSKESLQKAKNDEEREDSWVQCDGCQLWQHRICGLYNNERDTEGKEEYICPKCRLKEIENGKGVQLPQTVLGAKDLPKTNLSDHIEQRLFRRLKEEREETAKFHGIELENVLEAEGLVVRVVVSVDKELHVKKEFRDIFDGEYYPEKLPFRSKLILLFQKLGGVDMCLFGMYVEEYGSECDGPNNRCVYISYLDSVKYFQPERKTAGGESLRTFVYHEILIGYLEHCKKRGFVSCYIWACPPKADDYIFYCHPETQKTPQQDKLRQWYKLMLKKAAEDGIVVDHTNLYNEFFLPTNQGNTKISAARLPYFDGAYWSFAAENVSKELEEERSGGICSKLPSKQFLMTMGQENPTKDVLVMHKLRKTIVRWKENFMIVRLQYNCTYCHEVILRESRWSCNQCNKIHLCSRCFGAGKLLSPSRMHTCHPGKNSRLSENVLSDVPLDTKDIDGVLVNGFFESRSDFLNKCQISQYQFNTLNNAKYSSMMILYHFTNDLVVQPISTKKLTNQVTTEPKIEEPMKQEIPTLKDDLIVHASRCKTIQCSYPSCQAVKEIMHHSRKCTVSVRNGCLTCRKAWGIIKMHTKNCTNFNCGVCRCVNMRKQRAAAAFNSENKIDPAKSRQQ